MKNGRSHGANSYTLRRSWTRCTVWKGVDLSTRPLVPTASCAGTRLSTPRRVDANSSRYTMKKSSMATKNPDNERIKHRYFAYLREAKRLSEASIDGVAAALHRFGVYIDHRDFKAFHYQQAVAFKRYLADQVSQRRGRS